MADPQVTVVTGSIEDIVDRVVERVAELLMPEPAPRLATKQQAAQALGISVPMIDRLRRDGMPWIGVGDAVRIDVDEAIAWLRARTEARDA